LRLVVDPLWACRRSPWPRPRLAHPRALTEAQRNLYASTAAAVDEATATVLHLRRPDHTPCGRRSHPEGFYAEREAAAAQRLERHCASSDWPSVAVALLLDRERDGIWSYDRDYFRCGVATWTTDTLRRALFTPR
jgi:hypothetical protein